MKFGQFSQNEKQNKIRYMPTKPGTRKFVIFPDDVDVFWTHYINNVTIKCPGMDVCPACRQNSDLRAKYPDMAARGIPGYIRTSKRYAIPTIDVTVVKVCEDCGKENNQKNVVCECGRELPASAEQLNLPSVLEIAERTYNALVQSVTTFMQEQDIKDTADVVITMTVSGEKLDKVFTFNSAKRGFPLPVVTPIDIKGVKREYTPEQVVKLMSGVPLKDIIAEQEVAHGSGEAITGGTSFRDSAVSSATFGDADSIIKEIFGED